ncbi:hypothetical protein [Novosphingobium cyanobacteriorum]|uniref:Replication protein n=1 Tax=Novosphingobium cyanobacteriorum TaxID=3024215 RepID=A0ABT6CFA9_9SPHN|nr:hypothetical protein [Novosphingobium cyanobacteriorum]MDF8332013.1 hypothetical protein [Novosphingobium cyanobacteriorum]
MARPRNRRKPNATGRSDTSRFVRLDYRILGSNAYRSLSPNGRSLLVELVMLYNGENNGSLYLSVRDGAHRMGVADLTAASRAFDDLVAMGFIELAQEAHFKVKASETSRARCWRLTWLVGPGRTAPSSQFLEREPEPQTPARKRMERGQRALKAYRKARDGSKLPVLDCDTIGHFDPDLAPGAVLDSDTPNMQNGSFQPKSSIQDSATHIATTMGSGARRNLIGWWQPDFTPQLAALTFAAVLTSNHRSMAA